MPADEIRASRTVPDRGGHSSTSSVLVRYFALETRIICKNILSTAFSCVERYYNKLMFYPLIQNDQGGGYFLERNGTHVLAAIAVSSKKIESGKIAQMNQSALVRMYSTYSVQEISFLLLETFIQVALAPSPWPSAT